MSISIDYQDGEIQLNFPYNMNYINLIKTTTQNRRWNPEKRKWIMGLSDLQDQFIPTLKQQNIEFSFTDRYKDFFMKGPELINDFGLKFPLYPYQLESANKLYNNPKFGLFHEMGLGKTIVAIALINKLSQETPDIITPVERINGIQALVVCPSSLKKQWADEITKFSDLDCTVIGGTKKKREEQWSEYSTIKIINYENLRFDNQAFEKEWDVVVLDESTRVKNFSSKTSQKTKMLKNKRKIIATGTPLENSVADIYSMFQFLDPMVLGKWYDFKDEFLVTETKHFSGHEFEVITGSKNHDLLDKKIKPYYIRYKKDEVFADLPKLIEEKIYVQLLPTEKKWYNHIKSMIESKIEIIKQGEDVSIGGELQLLRILCNGEVCLKKSNTTNLEIISKQDQMTEISSKIEETLVLLKQIIMQKEKVIVFNSYTTPLGILGLRLQAEGIKYAFLHGGSDKEKEIEMFKTQEDVKVFLCQTKTGGYGLNLQEANNIIFMNLPWTDAAKEQAISRAHRCGQEKPVFVYTLVVQDTIEEKVLETIKEKKSISEKVIKQDIHKYI